jgi:hypothetical protein
LAPTLESVRIDSANRPPCSYWGLDDEECNKPSVWIYDSGTTVGFMCDGCRKRILDLAPMFEGFFKHI